MLLCSCCLLLAVGVMNISVGNLELGVMCMIMGPYMLIQIPTNVCMSGIVGVSAKSKKMNVKVVGAMGSFAMAMNVLLNTVILVLGTVVFDFIPAERIGSLLFYSGLTSLLLGVYMVIGQKYFYVSFAIFLAVFFGVFFGVKSVGFDFIQNMSFTAGIIVYLIMTCISALCFHLLLRLLYKAPWDPKSMRTGLGG